jgi:putative hydrolase of the HAD superfamily
MTIKGCMFDFSGTLLRIEPAGSWLRAVLDEMGIAVPEAEFAAHARRLARTGGQPGGAQPEVLPPHLEQLWGERDRTAAQHRAAYTGLAREAALPWGEAVYDKLYDRHMTPAAWRPYPDACEVLGELRRRGTAVAVVSNIGWDLRPVLREHGLERFVDVFVLSYEHGIQKPDPRIFRIACEGLGLPPEQVAMVGDDRRADAGAAALGCPVHLVDHLPVEQRPDGLRPVLRLLDA